jgi:hypothetical protein
LSNESGGFEAGLVFGDDLWFETAMTVSRNLDWQFPEVAFECLAAFAIASIAACIGNGFMIGMPQMIGHFCL